MLLLANFQYMIAHTVSDTHMQSLSQNAPGG